jgi:hypothetical protein
MRATSILRALARRRSFNDVGARIFVGGGGGGDFDRETTTTTSCSSSSSLFFRFSSTTTTTTTTTTAPRESKQGDENSGGTKEEEQQVVYVAALGDTVRKVKLLSLASLGATCAGCPLFLELSQPEMLLEAKMAVNATVIGFGSFTTALLQWFISPYVKTMTIDAKDGAVVAKKFAWNARVYETRFDRETMREAESSRPLVSWEANGRYYYVEMGGVPRSMYEALDLGRFDDQAKAEAAAAAMADDEDDDDDFKTTSR